MQKLLNKLATDYPSLIFQQDKSFYWSPQTQQIFFNPRESNDSAEWSLLHETAHALLGHKNYTSDVELLNLEVAAWEKAKSLSSKYGITIDDKHIQTCLDSYRDWIYRRAVCPQCGATTAQQDHKHVYACFNCHHTWQVSASRFCRPYRRTSTNKKSSATVFAADDLAL